MGAVSLGWITRRFFWPRRLSSCRSVDWRHLRPQADISMGVVVFNRFVGADRIGAERVRGDPVSCTSGVRIVHDFRHGMPILISVYPAGRGEALGIAVSAVYLGLSSAVSGRADHTVFRLAVHFLDNLPLGLLLIAVIFLMLKGDWAEAKGRNSISSGRLFSAPPCC